MTTLSETLIFFMFAASVVVCWIEVAAVMGKLS